MWQSILVLKDTNTQLLSAVFGDLKGCPTEFAHDGKTLPHANRWLRLFVNDIYAIRWCDDFTTFDVDKLCMHPRQLILDNDFIDAFVFSTRQSYELRSMRRPLPLMDDTMLTQSQNTRTLSDDTMLTHLLNTWTLSDMYLLSLNTLTQRTYR